ncbi:alpha/beta fold hydrolase [Ruixingdingia sedimenti]|uniref:Alpha/beta fold hydrolase n=1 Tax=Ruixingdingia sedimenti TaxID=3073604 RepID=A0ABU1F8C1_9RHOB|nr:alpha/beta fold hydrolase [Xinfangfangia sp. LG-4]MDR5653112.1 alpha/beta fold hydrolase [Xinfangfangia sp. LG-4]
MLNTTLHGTATDRPPLIIAHGLFGSGRNWGAIARRLSDRRQVIAVDMRNHGDSPWSDRHDYPAMAGDLAEVIAAHGGQADVLGHSMGGKAAMMLALTHPDAVNRLVVADVAPVAYDHDQRRNVDAMRGLDLTGLTSRSEADRRLAAVIGDPTLRSFFLQSLDLRADPPRWRLNLDVLAAEMDRIVGWPEPEAGYPPFPRPALFLSGALSNYVRPEYRAQIKALFPAARQAKIPGTGHWLHAENPRAFEAAVAAFLEPVSG